MIDKIAFIFVNNSYILRTESKGKDVFYISGGKRERCETDEQTLIREIREELDVDIELESMHNIDTFVAESHGAKTGIPVQMTCYKADYLGNLKASNQIEEIAWLNTKDVNPKSPVDKKYSHA